MSDFSNIVKSAGVALEKEAFKQFGAAVENKVSAALGSIFGEGGAKLTPPDSTDAKTAARQAQIGIWDPSKYAATIASSAGGFQPKNKFLFKVKFEIYEEVKQAIAQLDPSIAKIIEDLTFTVKAIDLPSVEFEYQTVNMYNFRTRVLKSISYKDLDISFYDDVSNNSLNFVKLYMMVLMPISRTLYTAGFNLSQNAMAFSQNYTAPDTAYRGALPLDISASRHDIISSMTIEQYYFKPRPEKASPMDAIKMNTFVFTNPKITNMDTGELDHERGSDASVVSATFNFESIYIKTGEYAISSKMPSIPGSDILDGSDEAAATGYRRGVGQQEGRGGNPLIDILANQAKRAIKVGLSNALNKKFGGIAGGALSGAIGAISGGLSSAAGNTLKTVATGISQQIAIPKSPFIRGDSNTSSSDAEKLSSSSTPI